MPDVLISIPQNDLAPKPRRIFVELRSDLLSGNLRPGARLSLRPLAKRFEVGINTVAVALRALESEGFVEFEAGVGARVSVRDLAMIRSDFILRMALETEVVRQCASRFSESHARLLGQLADAADQLAQDEDLEAAREADQRFHLTLARLAEAPSLERALGTLLPRLVVLEHGSSSSREGKPLTHRHIVDAFGKSESKAVSAIREHILDAQEWAIGQHLAES